MTDQKTNHALTESLLNVGLGRTASSINIEMMETCNAWNRLVMYPEQQARTIAEHYAAHYQLARELLMALNARQDMFGGDTTNVDNLIDNLVRQIKQNHRVSFGIELEWPNV